MRANCFLCAIVCFSLLLRLDGQQNNSAVVVPSTTLDQDLTRASRNYLSIHPDLLKHRFTAPKQQVLKEIQEVEAAERRLTTIQRDYYERKIQDLDAQVKSLDTIITSGWSNFDHAAARRRLDAEADVLDRALRDRKAELAVLTTKSDILTDSQKIQVELLKKEISNDEETLRFLDEASRTVARQAGTVGDPMESIKVLRNDLENSKSVAQDQLRLVKELEASNSTLYDDLRQEQLKRPDDTSPSAKDDPQHVSSKSEEPRQAAAPSDSSNTTSSAKVPLKELAGMWVLPEAKVGLGSSSCKLKAAELDLKRPSSSRGHTTMSGTLNLHLGGDCSAELGNPRNVPEWQLSLNVEGEAGSGGANISSKKPPASGKLKIDVLSDFKAEVKITFSAPSKLGPFDGSFVLQKASGAGTDNPKK